MNYSELLQLAKSWSNFKFYRGIIWRLRDIKENENFRRFNYRSKEKVYKEFLLYAIGRNILKYHRFLQGEIKRYEGKKEQKAA